jgi:hypothetical protein
MKILTKTITEPKNATHWLCPVRKGDIRQVKSLEETFCCKEMQEAWGEYLQFGDSDFLNKNANVNLIKAACYPSGTVVDYMAIQFCPFCGRKIEIENVETIEATK